MPPLVLRTGEWRALSTVCVKEINEIFGKLELLFCEGKDATASRDAAIQAAASLQVQQDMLLALQPVFHLSFL